MTDHRCVLLLYCIMTMSLGGITEAYRQPLHHRLFGEWSIWHSNVPSFMGPNSMVVGLYPDSIIEVSQKFCIGPCLVEKTKVGKYQVGLEYEYEKKNDLDPVYRTSVHIEFHQRSHHLLSLFGVGLDSFPLKATEPFRYQQDMSLFIVEQGDLYLTFPSSASHDNEDETIYCYHLVRNVRAKEPSVNVPLSTLVVTHVISSLITDILRHVHVIHGR